VAAYALDIRPRARRSLRQLDPPVRKTVAETVDSLEDELRDWIYRAVSRLADGGQ
jgi:mRNA-degrading endonuclease RelE of RelBE toxin-antitoxin system